jgi:chemotaxis protein methyltransferase CheR
MILSEMAQKFAGWRIEIVATDISPEVLERAKSGLYSQFEVQRGLPIQMVLKYFTQVGDQWQIVPAIRAMVDYKPLNLIKDFSHLGSFDIIFCRNVLIYFDAPTKGDVLKRMAATLASDGTLLLGAAETVIGISNAFIPHPDHRGVYVPSSTAAVAASMPLRAAAGR